jgi:hypothetical protein
MGVNKKKWYPTQDDYDARDFCIVKNIKIYRGATVGGKLYIGVEINGKEAKDPNLYTDEESIEKYYEYCRYYYAKYKDKL